MNVSLVFWKCERRYMRSHSWVKVVEPNDFPRNSTSFPLSSPLNIEHLNIWIFEHLNIWTFEHLNIWTLEHLDMLISAAFNILYAFTFLSALTFLSVLPYLQSSVRMCRWTSICSFFKCEGRYMRSHFYLRSHFGSKCERRYLAWNLIDRGILD